MSTLSDPEGRRSIADFLTKQYVSYYPVGRLDYDSTGLVILTNDGELADRLMHPRYGFIRTYMARVEGHVSDRTIEKIRTGVTLQDGPAKAEAEIEENRGDSTWVRISVGEGRNRLIRRIMEKVEHPVMKLKRIGHGPFKLGSIRPGEMKKLSEREYRYFREKVFAGPEDKTRSEKLTFSKKVRK